VSAFRLPVLKADLGLPSVTTVNTNTQALFADAVPVTLFEVVAAIAMRPVKVRGRVSSTWLRIKGI
jgi:hypothetical protein